MTILCATHFSEAARQAATAAAELAHQRDVPLLLAHVLPGDLARTFGQALRDTAAVALTQEARRVEQVGSRARHQLLTGEPAEELARFVQERKVGLVVTAGPPSGSRFLGVGGTVERLATVLPVPLLVVRQAEPFVAWARGTRPLKVLLGVERSPSFEAARAWLQALRRLGAVDVVAGHLTALQGEALELRGALEQEVRALISPLEAAGQPPVRMRGVPGGERLADSLLALAVEEQVDLLVVGSRTRRAGDSPEGGAHPAVRLATMAVASVPEAPAPSDARP